MEEGASAPPETWIDTRKVQVDITSHGFYEAIVFAIEIESIGWMEVGGGGIELFPSLLQRVLSVEA